MSSNLGFANSAWRDIVSRGRPTTQPDGRDATMAQPENGKVRVSTLDELAKRESVVASGGRHGIVVFYHEGKVYAVDNRCPHMGFPLNQGSLRCGILTCHWHHARFDLASGGTFDPFADDVRVYPTEVRDGVVWVDLTPASGDRVAKAFERLRDGLEQNLSLVIVKSLLVLLDAGVKPGEILSLTGAFGTTYRAAGWGPGLTILTAMGNVVDQLPLDEHVLALFHGLSHVADDCQGQPPRFERDPLATRDLTVGRLKEWYREFVEVRDGDGAERVLRTAIQDGNEPVTVADMMLAAATDHYFLNGGHTVDFLNKAFELLDCAGWDRASEILPSLIDGLSRAQRSEESNAWRHPVDLIALVDAAIARLAVRPNDFGAVLLDPGQFNQLVERLLGDDPTLIVDLLERSLNAGVAPRDLATVLAAAAGLRVARFHTSNEFGDWITVLHTFSYANALQQLLKRTPSIEGIRGIFHGAMRLYLDRFLNVPSARLPGLEDRKSTDSEPGGAERILDDLLALFDRQQQANPAGVLVYRYLATGASVQRLIQTLGRALLREDAEFHSYQMFEASVRQFRELEGRQPELAGSMLVGCARYLAAHAPTARSMLQTARIAQRLHRGEDLTQAEVE